MIVNKALRFIVFVIYVIWNIPIWLLFMVLGTAHLWKGSWKAFHAMGKNINYYD